MTKLIGRNPNQVPTNNMLGNMAYQNSNPKVGFHAGLTNTFSNSGSTTPITFDNTTNIGNFNYGNHYSTTSGTFVVPSAGLYHFNVQILAQSLGGGDNVEVYIRLNRGGSQTIMAIGSRMSYQSEYTGESGYMEARTSRTMELRRSDQIYAAWYRQGSSGIIHGNQAWSFFSGFKVNF